MGSYPAIGEGAKVIEMTAGIGAAQFRMRAELGEWWSAKSGALTPDRPKAHSALPEGALA